MLCVCCRRRRGLRLPGKLAMQAPGDLLRDLRLHQENFGHSMAELLAQKQPSILHFHQFRSDHQLVGAQRDPPEQDGADVSFRPSPRQSTGLPR